jgi:hypothetical protein
LPGGTEETPETPYGELESMVMEVSIACFKILQWHLPGGTEEIQEKPSSELESMVMEVSIACFEIL